MTLENTTSKNTAGFTHDGHQYLTFSLGQETYGIEILRVQEIRGYKPATPIPNSPSWVRGVMNLRGTIVPVIDLRAKLGLESAQYGRVTVIIVVNVGTRISGLIVDSVSDVQNFAPSDIQPSPDLGSSSESRFARGIARVDESLVVLLDLERVLAQAEVESAAPAAV
jgi:purine-binding chemotaxis protein CheW